MRAVFMGTPAAAVPSLATLSGIADVAMVVTKPDKPKGRGRVLGAPPVKAAAREWGFDVYQPRRVAEITEQLAVAELDVGVVVAYGQLLPRSVLTTTRLGFVNVHFSLLPRWRGAAPVEHAILAGDRITGVSLMVLDEGLDTGPLIAARETEIEQGETAGALSARLAALGASLLAEVLPDYATGRRRPAPQMTAGATTAPRLDPAMARLDPATDATTAERLVRALHPRPGVWIPVEGDRIRLLEVAPAEHDVVEGRIEVIAGRPILGLAGGALELVRLQPPGKRPQTGRAWANGRRGRPAAVEP